MEQGQGWLTYPTMIGTNGSLDGINPNHRWPTPGCVVRAVVC